MSMHAGLAVDAGDPPGTLALLRRELAVTPGRLGNTLRLVVLVLMAVAISETFRIPEPALSAYVVLFVSRAERASTVMTALVAGIAVMVAVLTCLVVFMASLSEPALRLPLIAAATFAAMFLARVSPLGPALFAAGFIVAYGLTLGDEVLGLALQPGTVANNTDFGLPQLAFVPPEEALVQFLLWLALVVAMPVSLVIAGNLLTGRDPALVLRTALAARLRAAWLLCAGEAGASGELILLAREGDSDVMKLAHLSRAPRSRATDKVLIGEISRLSLVLLAALRLPPGIWPVGLRNAVSHECHIAMRAVQDGAVLENPLAHDMAAAPADAASHPLMAEIWRALGAIRLALTVEPGLRTVPAGGARTAQPFLAPDAFTNSAHLHFALKVTLAVLLCYAVQDLTDWPGIHTCIITCFFVSLGTVGETLHKAALRLGGCLIGAALGIATIIFLMPFMTELGDLLLVLAVVTFVAGWVANGGERSSYAGWQIGLAFYLTVLQGVGPTLDMETARDRIIGILIGNIVVTIIFTTIWPVRVGDTVRAAIAGAIRQLAAMVELPLHGNAQADDAEPGLRAAFGAAIEQARAVLINDPYERPLAGRGARPIDAAILLELQALLVPVSVLLDLRADPAWFDLPAAQRDSVAAYHRDLGAWLRRCAAWVGSGTGADEIARSLPAPPGELPMPAGPARDHLAARLAWCGLLDRDIRAILQQIGPQPAAVASMAGPLHALA